MVVAVVVVAAVALLYFPKSEATTTTTTSTTTTSTTTSIPVGWSLYENQDQGVSFIYPSDWEQGQIMGAVMFMETGTGVNVNLVWESGNQMSMAEYLSASKEHLQTLLPGIRILDEGNVTVNGGACYKLVTQYELQQVFLKATQIIAPAGTRYFVLTLTASEVWYNQYEDTFNQIIESLTIEDVEATYLQTDFGEFKDKLDELQENYDRLLAQSEGFPSGSTFNQLVSWDYLRTGITNLDDIIYGIYADDNILAESYEIANDYLRSMLVDLINVMHLIKDNASPQWYLAIEKFLEAANWDIRSFDNYRLYLETFEEQYYSDFVICYNNSVEAGEAAWAALNDFGDAGSST